MSSKNLLTVGLKLIAAPYKGTADPPYLRIGSPRRCLKPFELFLALTLLPAGCSCERERWETDRNSGQSEQVDGEHDRDDDGMPSSTTQAQGGSDAQTGTRADTDDVNNAENAGAGKTESESASISRRPDGLPGESSDGGQSPRGNSPTPRSSTAGRARTTPGEAYQQAERLQASASKAAATGNNAEAFSDALIAWQGLQEHPNDTTCRNLSSQILSQMRQYADAASKNFPGNPSGSGYRVHKPLTVQ